MRILGLEAFATADVAGRSNEQKSGIDLDSTGAEPGRSSHTADSVDMRILVG